MLGGGHLLGGAGLAIKSIQRGTIVVANAASTNTAAITAVDTNNAILRHLGSTIGGTDHTDSDIRLDLTNGTTITATRAGTSGAVTVSYEIVEFYPGVIKSIQRGTITTNGVASNTATITSVDTTKAECHMLGYSDNATASSANSMTRLALTNATTVTVTCGSSAALQNTNYQVVEYY